MCSMIRDEWVEEALDIAEEVEDMVEVMDRSYVTIADNKATS